MTLRARRARVRAIALPSILKDPARRFSRLSPQRMETKQPPHRKLTLVPVQPNFIRGTAGAYKSLLSVLRIMHMRLSRMMAGNALIQPCGHSYEHRVRGSLPQVVVDQSLRRIPVGQIYSINSGARAKFTSVPSSPIPVTPSTHSLLRRGLGA